MEFYVYNHELDEVQPADASTLHRLHIGHYNLYLMDILKKIDNCDIKVLIDVHSINNNKYHTNFSLVNSSDIDLVIFPRCDHQFGIIGPEHITNTGIEKPWVVLDANTEVDHPRFIFCPFWAMIYPTRFQIETTVVNVGRADTKYIVSCLNNTTRDDRLMNLTRMLENSNRFDPTTTLVTMGFDDRPTVLVEGLSKHMEYFWSSSTRVVYEECVIDKLPIINDCVLIDRPDLDSIVRYDNPAYLESFINIVTEYCGGSDSSFMSEKIFKPILAGQFFVALAGPSTMSLLRGLGFDLYDDILRHDSYDSIPQTHLRIDAMHYAIPDLTKEQWSELYRNTENRRMANRELLLSGEIEQRFVDQLGSLIKSIIDK